MGIKTVEGYMSFLSCEAKRRVKKENQLMKLERMLDWRRVDRLLKGIYAYEVNGNGGQKPYDSVKMFKALLLGQWHDHIWLCLPIKPIGSPERGAA